MNGRWRLIDTGSRDPYSNMAIDEALLRSYERGQSLPTLRVYGWEPAGLSLGCSQDTETILDTGFCGRAGLAFVRRITGGGIILHSNELTYSLVCRKADLGIPDRIASSYKIICSFLVEFYKSLGLDASFACDNAGDEKLGLHCALCFAGKEKYDIIIDGKKIGGNAQKRSGDIVFQHGSIPLKPVAAAGLSFMRDKGLALSTTETACLESLLGRQVLVPELSELLARSFGKAFGVEMERSQPTYEEDLLARDLKIHKYGTDEWNVRHIDPTHRRTSAPVGQ